MSQQINLFNPIFLKKKKYFSAATMLQALGMIAVGTVLMGAYASFELSRLRPEANAVSAQLEAARARLAVAQAQAARQKDGALEAEVRRTEAEVLALQRAVQSLAQGDEGRAGNRYSDYMRAFSRQIVDGLWLTGFAIGAGGSEVSISGAAVRPALVPAYLTRLGAEPVLRRKSFDMLEMNSLQKEAAGTVAPSSAVAFRLRSGPQAPEGPAAGGGQQ